MKKTAATLETSLKNQIDRNDQKIQRLAIKLELSEKNAVDYIINMHRSGTKFEDVMRINGIR